MDFLKLKNLGDILEKIQIIDKKMNYLCSSKPPETLKFNILWEMYLWIILFKQIVGS